METRAGNMIEVACPLCDARDSSGERVVDGHGLSRCRPCGFVFANPQHPPDELLKIYDNPHVEHLISLYSRIASPRVIADYRVKLDLIERHLPGRGRLLDLGCAAGYFFEQAALRGWDAHGSDVGAWSAEAAARRGVKNLHVGSLHDLEFPDGHFDVVYAAQIFEHLPRPLVELAEIRRILRPGGLLYIDVPNYRTLPILLGQDDFMFNAPPQHLNYFTPRTLGALLKLGGFSTIRIGSGGGLKWENLLGRSISSEIKDAYESEGGDRGPARGPSGRPGANKAARALKSAARDYFVRPMLYDALRFGMLLNGLARRGQA